MAEKQTSQTRPNVSEEEKKEFLEKLKKTEEKKKIELLRQLATREKLERDYEEDTIFVTFYTSPETKRTIKAKKPSPQEMIDILMLSAEAAKYEGRADPDSLAKMAEIYQKLPKLAARLSVDEKLDEEFWSKHVSFTTLQNFIFELIAATQRSTLISEEELESFRKE
ncbi:MAG: hypothetical protein DRP62_00045 [Planctomycetota bacterium]|nr:MAG: hypothetical protein DRP62_00045 [Planctomycetota bacterium]